MMEMYIIEVTDMQVSLMSIIPVLLGNKLLFELFLNILARWDLKDYKRNTTEKATTEAGTFHIRSQCPD